MNDFKKYLNSDQIFHYDFLKKNNPLSILLDKSLEQYLVSAKDFNVPNIIWGEKRYQLSQSKVFRELKEQQQNHVYQILTENALAMSYYIEKSGHCYGAKMILLSEYQEEKSLYALFTAEEAIHQREFMNFMNFTPDPEKHWHPMLNPLGDAIKEAEKTTLIYIIQVLLEGFGIGHYHHLMETCNYAPLKQVYARILKDEARHHGAGVIHAQMEKPENNLVKDQIFEYSREFIKSLNTESFYINPIEQARGSLLSIKEKELFLDEIKFSKITESRKLKMKDILSKVDQWGLVSLLEKNKVL